MFFNIILIGIILFLLFMLSMIWPPDSPWAPWWRTNKKTALAICKFVGIKKSDVVYDLGCGDAEVLLWAAKIGANGVGIEIDPLRYIIAKFRIFKNGFNSKIFIKRKNFFKEEISSASIIIVYLVPKTLDKLIPKFKRELKKGTKIVSYRYEMDLKMLKKDLKNKIFLYTI